MLQDQVVQEVQEVLLLQPGFLATFHWFHGDGEEAADVSDDDVSEQRLTIGEEKGKSSWDDATLTASRPR